MIDQALTAEEPGRPSTPAAPIRPAPEASPAPSVPRPPSRPAGPDRRATTESTALSGADAASGPGPSVVAQGEPPKPAANGEAGPPGPGRPGPSRGYQGSADIERAGCTGPQLRRFIKSRAYVPMHELRRRFAIDGADDDVTPVDVDRQTRVYIGLPSREGRLLGELLRSGDIGYELSFDPIAPIVVGVFPMRPVPRS